MGWSRSVECFVSVANNQSFAKAAKALATTSSSVSKQIQWLENHLGVKLLTRTTRQVDLTPEGREFLAQAEPLQLQWQALKENMKITKEAMAGCLRIACTPVFGKHFVLPLISSFQDKYPAIMIYYTEKKSCVNLLDERIDIYIGLGEFIRDKATTTATTLTQDFFQCFAAKKYLKKNPEPQSIHDITQHKCLVMAEKTSWELNGEIFTPNTHFVATGGEPILEACKQGMGICYLPSGVVKQASDNGLQVVLPAYRSQPFLISACRVRKSYALKRVDAFMQHVKDHFS